MKVAYFTHSLLSCWNHGNAHFLRGVLSELQHAGHAVSVYEPADAWSLANLRTDHGEAGLAAFHAAYPNLSSHSFEPNFDVAAAIADADLVIVHEWNEPWLVAAIGAVRREGGSFQLFFHDTHHRAVSAPDEMRRFDLDGYDGVLAFGEALAEIYRGWGWADRVLVWHEAADTRLFRPPATEQERSGLVWIGNWGDGERSAELETFLLRPARDAGLALDIHGVRYPPDARTMLDRYGVRFGGWLPNASAPAAFARRLATVHVPRRFYVETLPGIPTIRVFEALACGIPLLSAPWRDTENLFRVGDDFLMAHSEAEMQAGMRDIAHDAALRLSLVKNGLETIHTRHTCAHRVQELLAFAAQHARVRLELVG